MKKIISIISLLSAINVYGAKLVYDTNGSLEYQKRNTRLEEGLILKQTNLLHKSNKDDYIIITDDNKSYMDNYSSELGTNKLPKIYHISDSSIISSSQTKSEDGIHLKRMLLGFKTYLSDNMFEKAMEKTLMTPYNMSYNLKDGIVSVSASKSGRPKYHMNENSLYFGNTVNEFLFNVYFPQRFLNEHLSDNANLFILGFNNSEKISDQFRDDKNSLKNDQVIVPLQTTTEAFTNFGIETQKLYRAETMFVNAYDCGDFAWGKDANNKVTLNHKGDIVSTDKWLYKNTTANTLGVKCTLALEKGFVSQLPLYGRSMAVVNYAGQASDGGVGSGTSFATPRTAGLAYLLKEKFQGLTYHQIKQIIFTTAYRDKDLLSNEIGWGYVDPEKALNGPSALNPGLIEEQKFFTGMYDKIFSKVDNNIFFWADVQNDWTWNNDIYGALREFPTTKESYYNIMTDSYIDKYIETYGGVADNVNVQNYIESEKNFYKKTTDYLAGLRKAGRGTLTINGNMYFDGETQVLEGHLIANGNITGEFSVFENATATINKNNLYINNNVHLYGGTLNINGNTRIKQLFISSPNYIKLNIKNGVHVTIDALKTNDQNVVNALKQMSNVTINSVVAVNGKTSDIRVNPYKFVTINTDLVFNGKGYNLLSTNGSISNYNKAKKKYNLMKNMPESIKQNALGYKNGRFTLFDDPDVTKWSTDNYVGLSDIIIHSNVNKIYNKNSVISNYSKSFMDSFFKYNASDITR